MIFILIFLLGLSLLAAISRDFKGRELLALAMPIGLGTTTFIMFLLDRLTHSITLGAVTGAVAALVVIFGLLRLYSDKKHNDLPWQRKFTRPDMSWLTLVWIVLAGMTAYLAWGITEKCLYWPPAEFDTILGYDLLSKAVAHEHVITNSMLTNPNIVNGCGPRMLYPPLLTLCNAICYMDGMESPRLINSLFFISWIFIMYQLLRRFVGSTGAMLFTFLTVIVPEMFAHASFSLTNLPCAIYTTIAVLSFVIWYEQRREGFFYLSFIAVIFGIWTRSEAVLFAGGIMAVLFYDVVKGRDFKELAILFGGGVIIGLWNKFISAFLPGFVNVLVTGAIFGVLFYVTGNGKRTKYLLIYATSVVPFLMWNAFLKAYVPRDQAGPFIKSAFYDPGKMKQVITTAWEIMGSYNIYGLTFYIGIAGLIIVFALNVGVNFSKQKNKVLLGAFVLWLLVWFVAGASFFTIGLFMLLMLAGSYLNDDKWEFLLIFFLAYGAYTLVFYQMKEDGTLFSSGGWMQSGYKRGLFCYAPLILFIFITSKWVSYAFNVLDEQMVLFRKRTS